MKCEELKQWLSAEIDGEIRAGERRAVRQHRAICPACRQAREATERLEEQILAAAGRVPADAARDEVILAALRAEGHVRPVDPARDNSPRRWGAPPFLRPRWAGVALASAAAGLLGLGLRTAMRPHASRRSLVAQAGSPGRPGVVGEIRPRAAHPAQSPGQDGARGAPGDTATALRAVCRPVSLARGAASTLHERALTWPLRGRLPRTPSPDHWGRGDSGQASPESPLPQKLGPEATGKRPAQTPPAPRVPLVPDAQYLDGRDPRLLAYWSGEGTARDARLTLPQVPAGDDFVFEPFPQLASAAPGGGTAMSEAVHQYEAEKRVVDPRLFQQVTLHEKAAALDDICRDLAGQTGVKLEADRVVADEKATVLVEKKPARDVMREIARLFGYQWLRSGEPGSYRYELTQDLRSQLAEEQLRNQDIQQALLDLDAQMSVYRPYLDQSVDQLRARLETARGEEEKRLWRLARNGGWGPAKLYFRLSPAERDTLLSGGMLRYTMDDSNPDHRLPADWRVPLLKSTDQVMAPSGNIVISQIAEGKPSTPIEQVPNAEPTVQLRLDRSEAGEFTLEVGTQIQVKTDGKVTGGSGYMVAMATGRSPSATKPDNATANQALRAIPSFQAVIGLQPQPSCPRLAANAEPARKGAPDRLYPNLIEPELREPHVNTADVWEEIHRRTGLPVVADSYMHLFPVSSLTVKQQPMFDALCQAGDKIGVRWKKDGEFLLGRSTSYFWDKLKEVPNRLLRRWQQDSRANDGLPLTDLLEMASLSDLQLGSKPVGEQICHCWELDEWGIIGGGPFIAGVIVPEEMRKMARALTLLTPAQLQQAQQPEGLALTDLTPAQREEMEEKRFHFLLYDATAGLQPRFHLDYVPSGRYYWQPTVTEAQYKAVANRWPVVAAKTAAAALAEARQYDPDADAGSIHRTRGRLDFTFLLPDGERHSTGGPLVGVRLE